MTRCAVAIAYDGAFFQSYARQPGQRTVEGEILRVLVEAGAVTDAAGCRFASASRTDAGVSARHNVVAFDSNKPPAAVAALGPRCPPGLLILGARGVPDGFDPRHARNRTYRYFVDEEWPWARVESLALAFEGVHDFANFRRADGAKSSQGRLDRVRFLATGPALEVRAPSFLWQQVRRIVGALDDVAQGRRDEADVRAALEHPTQRASFTVAPPEGLVLWNVAYADLAFPPAPRVARTVAGEAVAARSRGLRWARAVAALAGRGLVRRS